MALWNFRDDPLDSQIPDEVAPTSYHHNKIQEISKEISELESMALDECQKRSLVEHQSSLELQAKRVAERSAQLANLKRMLAMVVAWTPPTGDHSSLKRFMLDQLNSSIDSCYYVAPIPETALPGAQWRDSRLAVLREDIEYHAEENQRELDIAARSTRWIKQLKESL